MQRSRWWVGCLLALVIPGCRDQQPSSFDSNLAPETVITGAPAESSQAYYRVHLKWYGSDPDGSVDHFEYAVTDTNKVPGETTPGFSGFIPTERTDSLFVFSANLPQILGHRFYVRAIDNEGKTDPTPAWAYFVAEDFNPPSVRFTSGIGTWIDRRGALRSTSIRSSNRFAPTDTIGVGGSVVVSWTGFDTDPGDSIIGFEYRLSTSPIFAGGTLADTTAATTFSRPAGSALSSYFSGAEAFLVHAIDVAGAKTSPDSVRSFVVNFSPVTWIVDPDQIDPPVRKLVFSDKETFRVWPSGTFLADGFREIQFKYTAFDDSRDQSLDPNNPSGIIGYSYRILKDGGGLAYRSLDGRAYPLVNDFVIASPGLVSGNYVILVRARDELDRDGKPDTIRVNVNYFPYFESVRYVDSLGVEQELWIPDSGCDGETDNVVTVHLRPGPGGGYPNLVIRAFARDDHTPPPGQHPRDCNPVVEEELGLLNEYTMRLNNARDGFLPAPLDSLGLPTVPFERSYVVDSEGGPGFIHAGTNRLELRCRDSGGRLTSLEFVFQVSLE